MKLESCSKKYYFKFFQLCFFLRHVQKQLKLRALPWYEQVCFPFIAFCKESFVLLANHAQSVLNYTIPKKVKWLMIN